MKNSHWLWLPVAAIVVPYGPAYATTYFSAEQAQQAIFPGATFKKAFVTLTDAQASDIESRSGTNVRNKEVQLWQASTGGYFFVDEVVGKHEFITTAVGLNADGSFKQIEIMDYKETYGFQVRDANWRKQFVGKTAASSLELGKDIKNISGATLSCKHITDGVKRILTTYAVLAQK